MDYEEVLNVLRNYNDYVKKICAKTAESNPVCEIYADLRDGVKTIESYINGAEQTPVQAMPADAGQAPEELSENASEEPSE